jgi:hypothetical protein
MRRLDRGRRRRRPAAANAPSFSCPAGSVERADLAVADDLAEAVDALDHVAAADRNIIVIGRRGVGVAGGGREQAADGERSDDAGADTPWPRWRERASAPPAEARMAVERVRAASAAVAVFLKLVIVLYLPRSASGRTIRPP